MAEPIIVSYSELDTFRQCPLKHHLTYRLRYTKPVKEDSALARGSLWHAVMEEHYKEIKAAQVAHKGRIPESVWGEVLANAWKRIKPLLYDLTTGEQSPNQNLIEWMYQGHVEKWGIDEQWKILGVEHQIITPLRDEHGKQSRFHLKAKMDLVVLEWQTGAMWVVDHKSGANLPTQMDLEIDDQFGLYTWAMREVGKPVLGSLHNANRTQRNKSFMPLDTRLDRTPLNRGEKELTNLALDAYHAARAAYPDDPRYEARYSSPDPRSCGWKCDVKEPHLLMRSGRPMQEVMMEYGFKIDRTRH